MKAFNQDKSYYAWAKDPVCVVSKATLIKRDKSGEFTPEECLTLPADEGYRRRVQPNLGNMLASWDEVKNFKAWERDPRCSVSAVTIKNRRKAGYSPEDSISLPPHTALAGLAPRAALVFAWGEAKTVAQWALDSRCSVSEQTIYARLRAGHPAEVAIAAARGSLVHLGPKIRAFGEEKYACKWAEDERAVVSARRLAIRHLEQGWDVEEAIVTPLREVKTLTIGDERKTFAEWTQHPDCTVCIGTIMNRLDAGWDPWDAAFAPPEEGQFRRSNQIKIGDVTRSTQGWAEDPDCVVGLTTYRDRVKAGMDPHEAMITPPNAGFSFAELEIVDLLEGWSLDVVHRDREALGGHEIDVYVPSRKFGIEHNGLYWHQEQREDAEVGVPRDYHAKKLARAQGNGIQLVQIWEDDWRDRRPIVESLLRHKLGLATEKVAARKCVVEEVEHRDATDFLNEHHIQGGVVHSVAIGLRHGGELIAVCTFKRDPGDGVWTLSRYATAKSVVGGFTRCLVNFCRSHYWTRIVSFADLTISDGGLYETSGFVAEKSMRPDYAYVVGGCRERKSQYRLKRFATDPDLKYDPDFTERQLAALNGLLRLYDAGKIRYVLTNNNQQE